MLTTANLPAASLLTPPESSAPPKKKKSRARKTSDKPTRIYSFRVLPPEDLEHRKLVDEQFWLAHQYRGLLTEIEIALRENFRAIDLDHPLTREAYYVWEAQSNTLDDLFAQLRAAKSGTAPEDRDLEQIIALIEEWKPECARAWKGVKEARANPEVMAHHQPRYVAARKAANKAKLKARKEFSVKGLMHGTYVRIEQAVERSVDSTGRPPQFERYQGEGSIGHQLPRRRDRAGHLHSVTAGDLYVTAADQAPRSRTIPIQMTALPDGWEDLPRTARRRVAKPYRGNARQQLHPRAVDARDSANPVCAACGTPIPSSRPADAKTCSTACRDVRKQRRSLSRLEARSQPQPSHEDSWQDIPARLDGQYVEMQFGWRPAKRQSTWVRFPLTHHRRLPADAEILWVHVHRWRVGMHYEWRVQLTIESDTFRRPAAPTAHAGTCALDIGWRRLLDGDGNQIGLRVGYLVDEYGGEREIRAPDGLWQRLAKVYSIAQIRSRELDTIRDRLVAWIGDRLMPEWFADRARGLPQWRAPRKMQRLADTWKKDEHRLDGDAEILAAILAWAKHDRHLGSWEAHMRDRTIAHRREVWRQIAAELARTYQTILVEDGLCRSEGREGQMKIVDIEGWNQLPPEKGDPHEGREQRRQSRMAAPGELRLAIAHATHKTATTVIDVARTKNSTRECAWCSHVQQHADFAATIEIQCENEDCRRAWDQDANAARNLLHRRDLSSGPVPPVDASGPVPLVDGKALAPDKRAKVHRKIGGDSYPTLEATPV